MNNFVIQPKQSSSKNKGISLAQWKDLVKSSTFLRLQTEPLEVVSPKTMEKIRINSRDGDAFLLLPSGETWHISFSFGSLIFSSRFPAKHEQFIKSKMKAIADALNCEIIHEGEEKTENW